MPESESKQNLRLRLSFDGSNKDDIDQWETSLLEEGVTVIGKSTIGLDIEGPREKLQEILQITITIDGDDIRVEDSPPSETLGTTRRPRMYSPRRPILF